MSKIYVRGIPYLLSIKSAAPLLKFSNVILNPGTVEHAFVSFANGGIQKVTFAQRGGGSTKSEQKRTWGGGGSPLCTFAF